MRNLLAFLLFVPSLCPSAFGQTAAFSLDFDMYGDYVEWEGPVIPSAGDFSCLAWSYCPYPVPTGGEGNSPDNGGYGNGFRNVISQGDEVAAIFIGYQPDGKMRVSHAWSNIEVQYPFGEWVHLGVVCNATAGTTTLYMNGEEVASTLSIMLPTPGTWFRVGRQWNNEHEDWFGNIDDVSLWDTPLDADEVVQYMNCAPEGSESGLIGLWNFDLGEGDLAIDQSPLGNNGLIYGAEYVSATPEMECGESAELTNEVDLGEDIETCLDFVTLDAGPGFDSYLWNTGDSIQSIEVTESGQYSVSVTEASNCNEHALLFDGMGQNVIVQEIEAYERDMHTVSLWCSIADMDGGMDLVSKDDELSNRQWLLQLTSLGQFYGHVWTGTDDLSGITSTTQLTENQWYYLTQTWDGEQLKIYINGTLEGAVDTGTGLDTGDYPVTIGGDELGWQAWTHGSIDNVEIWDVALNPEQIQTNMACSPSGQEEGIVAFWDFNAGDGSVAFDQSAYANHGSINGPLWIDAPSELDCQICEFTDEVLVDFDDCDGYCGEGTIWDNAIQQCVSIVEPCIPACAEGTVWNDDIQGCICSNDEPESNSDCECPTQPELDGFISYGSFEGSHYYFHPESMSWAMADSLSSLNGGHLVTIGSQQEQDHLETLLGWSTDAHWIGLYQNLSSAVYQEPLGGWEWVTGEPLDYDNWRIGEPNEATPGEDFGTYIPAEGWNDGHNGDVPQDGTPWPFIMEVPCCAEICNDPSACGPGTVWDPVNEQCIVAIPTDTDFDGCVTAGDVLNLLATFGTCPPIPFSGPCQGQGHVTYQGHDYDIVAIGEQCWFAENLQAESYRNGDNIESGLSDADWSSMSGATSVYGEGTSDCESFAPDGDACSSDWPMVQYGRLYNWHAVDDARELCPLGWHVPTVSEWLDLTDYLDSIGQSGVLMKTSTGWINNGGGSNDSGFSGQPAGYRSGDGSFQNAGKRGYWWSETPYSLENNSLAHYIRLVENEDHVDHFYDETDLGFSVRCIKD